MKITISKLAVIILLISSILSCNEEEPCVNCLEYEKDIPPNANAGTDLTLKYNTQTCSYETATLDGSLSSDPDNEITSYKWTIINSGSTAVVSQDSVFNFTPSENKEYLTSRMNC